MNMGATNHVTLYLNNHSIHSNHVGNDSLVVGSGKGLSISNIGSSHYLSNGNIVSLHDILHAPHISPNLLSIYQFTKDNSETNDVNGYPFLRLPGGSNPMGPGPKPIFGPGA